VAVSFVDNLVDIYRSVLYRDPVMEPSILYLGDTSLSGAAAYLAGLMHSWGWAFDYVPSNQRASGDLFERPQALYVLSDYPSANLAPALQEQLVEQVRQGAGLLMIGGWESFHGSAGLWNDTAVEQALPVRISGEDDRQNCDHPVLVRQVAAHPSVADLPWRSRPPLIGGLNRVWPKSQGTVVLEAQHVHVEMEPQGLWFQTMSREPLLVVGQHGAGRTAALATDVAPHWVGCLIDWGPERVSAQAPGAEAVEVGNLYAQFLRQLLGWAAGRFR
jgi:hypothetical protein